MKSSKTHAQDSYNPLILEASVVQPQGDGAGQTPVRLLNQLPQAQQSGLEVSQGQMQGWRLEYSSVLCQQRHTVMPVL